MNCLLKYQKEVLELIKNPPIENRSIYWYWEPTGKMGKSFLAKHICMNYNAMSCGGKKSDIMFGLAEWIKENKEIDVCVFDFERTVEDYVSYSAIESILNGNFFSTKFESKQCLFNPPWIVCFANWPPKLETVSADRWIVKNIRMDQSS